VFFPFQGEPSRRGVLLGLCGAAAALAFPGRARADQPLTFGITPQQIPSRVAEQWVPLIAEVSRRSGIPLQFRTARDIPSFERLYAAGILDFGYLSPYGYVRFAHQAGYRAFAHEKNRRLSGVIVVRADSPIHSLAELNGQAVAFPTPEAFGASMLTRAELDRRGIAYQPRFFLSHDSVYRNILAGTCPAGGGIIRTLEALPPEQRAQLRVLATTTDYAPHPFSAQARLPAATVDWVRDAMLSLNDDAAGQELLDGAGLQGITAAEDKEWDDVRALDLEKLAHWEEWQAK